MSPVKYGATDVEKRTAERFSARQIVQEILNFGVSQQQMLYVAYLLALELEERETMVEITETIKKHLDNIEESPKNEIVT